MLDVGDCKTHIVDFKLVKSFFASQFVQ